MPPTSPVAIARTLGGGLPPLGSGSHGIDVSTWGALEWGGYSAMALVCIWVLWRAVRTTVRPGEEAADHVKRSILDDDSTPFGPASSAPASTRRGARSPAATRHAD